MTNKYIDEIWSLHQNSVDATRGMGGYGVTFDIQREYYRKLPEDEKQKYEQAVLVLCQSNDVKKAKLALTICSQLTNVFPPDWAKQVIPLIGMLVEIGLQPVHTNTITYAVLDLIWHFNIYSLLPFVKEFREQITRNYKQGILEYGEWQQLYGQVSRILIKVSPDDFWKEFNAFYQDAELLHLVGKRVTSITFIWSSFGGVIYGLEWLSQLATKYSEFTDQELKLQALTPIEKSSNMALINYPSEQQSMKGFLRWLRSQLNDIG